jgi:hypothetical protein
LSAALNAARLQQLFSLSSTVHVVLLSGNTSGTSENVIVTRGNTFIVGENSSGTHAPIVFYGAMSFSGENQSISDNHFGVSNIKIIGITPLNFEGNNPQRLFLKNVQATASGTGHGLNVRNVGTGSSVDVSDCKFSHEGYVGPDVYYCIRVAAGTANLDSVETSGPVVSIGVSGGTCNITHSDIQSGGAYAILVNAANLTVRSSKISSSAANSSGLKLEANVFAVIGNVTFDVPAAGTGRAIEGVSTTYLWYGPLYFLPDNSGSSTNSKINPDISAVPLNSTPSFT